MHEYPDGSKKVRVHVIKDEKLPTHIDLRGGIPPRDKELPKKQAPEKREPDWREKYLRLAADLDNSKKRIKQTFDQQLKQEREDLLLDFLEVADNLDRAYSHAEASPEVVVEGIEAIQRQFQRTLAKYEVRSFDPTGQPFDPERHDAISLTNQPGLASNTVAKVLQTGYTIGDKVLRPARVIVAS